MPPFSLLPVVVNVSRTAFTLRRYRWRHLRAFSWADEQLDVALPLDDLPPAVLTTGRAHRHTRTHHPTLGSGSLVGDLLCRGLTFHTPLRAGSLPFHRGFSGARAGLHRNTLHHRLDGAAGLPRMGWDYGWLRSCPHRAEPRTTPPLAGCRTHHST